MLFYSFLCGKARTGSVRGGNTTEVYNNYEEDASYKKSKMLVDMHPDVVTLVERYGRTHHHVDISGFRNNKMLLRPDVIIKNKANEFGMKLARKYGTEEQFIDYDFNKAVYPSGRGSW